MGDAGELGVVELGCEVTSLIHCQLLEVVGDGADGLVVAAGNIS